MDGSYCGYKFGFAFVNNITQRSFPDLSNLNRDFCPSTIINNRKKAEFELPYVYTVLESNYSIQGRCGCLHTELCSHSERKVEFWRLWRRHSDSDS